MKKSDDLRYKLDLNGTDKKETKFRQTEITQDVIVKETKKATDEMLSLFKGVTILTNIDLEPKLKNIFLHYLDNNIVIDVNAQDVEGKSLLFLACEFRMWELAHLMLLHHSKPDLLSEVIICNAHYGSAQKSSVFNLIENSNMPASSSAKQLAFAFVSSMVSDIGLVSKYNPENDATGIVSSSVRFNSVNNLICEFESKMDVMNQALDGWLVQSIKPYMFAELQHELMKRNDTDHYYNNPLEMDSKKNDKRLVNHRQFLNIYQKHQKGPNGIKTTEVEHQLENLATLAVRNYRHNACDMMLRIEMSKKGVRNNFHSDMKNQIKRIGRVYLKEKGLSNEASLLNKNFREIAVNLFSQIDKFNDSSIRAVLEQTEQVIQGSFSKKAKDNNDAKRTKGVNKH